MVTYGEVIAAPVVGCFARKPYSEIQVSHCTHLDTDMAYCSISCVFTSRSQPRSFSQRKVDLNTSSAQRSMPLFCAAFKNSFTGGTSSPLISSGSGSSMTDAASPLPIFSVNALDFLPEPTL